MDSFMSLDDSEYKNEVAELNAATSPTSSPLGKRSRAEFEEESALPDVLAPGAWSPLPSSPRPRTFHTRSNPRGRKASHVLSRVAAAGQQVSTTIRRVGGTFASLHTRLSNVWQTLWGYFPRPQAPLEITALETDTSKRKRRAIATMPASPSNVSPEVANPHPELLVPTGKATLRERYERIEKYHADKEASAGSAPAQKPTQKYPTPQKKPAPVGLEPWAKKVARMNKSTARFRARTAAEKDAEVDDILSRAKKLTLASVDARDIPSSIKKDRRVVPEEKKEDEKPESPSPEPQLIKPVSQEWQDKLAEVMDTTSQTKSFAKTAEGIELTHKDFDSILGDGFGGTSGSAWLNDEIINGFFAAIVEQKKTQTGWVKGTPAPYAAFNTSWYNNVKNKGIASIKTWSRRKQISQEKLLEAEKVYFPLNSGAHWQLIIISPQTKEIEVLDSMNGRPGKYFKIAREWLAQELGKLYVESEWTESESVSCSQDNSDDCGAFTCWNGLASAKRLPYTQVTAEKMQDARRMMGAILLNGGFHGDFEL